MKEQKTSLVPLLFCLFILATGYHCDKRTNTSKNILDKPNLTMHHEVDLKTINLDNIKPVKGDTFKVIEDGEERIIVIFEVHPEVITYNYENGDPQAIVSCRWNSLQPIKISEEKRNGKGKK